MRECEKCQNAVNYFHILNTEEKKRVNMQETKLVNSVWAVTFFLSYSGISLTFVKGKKKPLRVRKTLYQKINETELDSLKYPVHHFLPIRK